MNHKSLKIVVTFERRPDGGLRVWSADVPGLILSHTDVDGVLADVKSAIEGILSSRLGGTIVVSPLDDIREALEHDGIVDPQGFVPGSKEYVAYCH